MLSNILDRISLASLSLVIILLPVFFLPFTRIPVEVSKGLILVVGLSVSLIFFCAGRFSDGKISLPKSPLIPAGLLIVLIFFVSALLSSSPKVSFFGTILDIGTFWYIFGAFLLMLLSSIIINTPRRARLVLLGVIASLGVVLILQFLRFFHPDFLSLGVLGIKTDNLLGSWNTFGLLAGLLGVILLFMIEFLRVSKSFKLALGLLLLISLVLTAAVNFSLVWQLIGAFALIIFVYKISIYSAKKEERQSTQFPIFSFVVVMVCLLFFMSSQFVGGFLPNRLGLSNIEVRPSISSTIDIAKSAIEKNPILGPGPNKFHELWSLYKPAVINDTQFWNNIFTSGSGLLPTLMINTGILGILGFALFFAIFLRTGVKALFSGLKKGVNQESVLFFLSALYLFIASWFYAVGFIVFLLAFAFSGIFIGTSMRGKKDVSVSFLDEPKKSFLFITSLIVLMVISAGFTFKYIERFASVAYFAKVYNSENIDEAVRNIGIATRLNPNDLYFRTANQVYIAKINLLLGKETALSSEEETELRSAFTFAEESAIAATALYQNNYLNHQVLGLTYSIAGSFGVEGGYDKAISSFTQASILNPLNPGLKLNIARIHFAMGNMTQAKSLVEESLTLKPDYIGALIVYSQIENTLGRTASAVAYAEKALALSPSDPELINYVNGLRSGTKIDTLPLLEEDPSSQ